LIKKGDNSAIVLCH